MFNPEYFDRTNSQCYYNVIIHTLYNIFYIFIISYWLIELAENLYFVPIFDKMLRTRSITQSDNIRNRIIWISA